MLHGQRAHRSPRLRVTCACASSASPLLAIVAAAALPSQASAALTASDVRIGAQPAFVRVVVDFTGGRVEFNETEATDPSSRTAARASTSATPASSSRRATARRRACASA